MERPAAAASSVAVSFGRTLAYSVPAGIAVGVASGGATALATTYSEFTGYSSPVEALQEIAAVLIYGFGIGAVVGAIAGLACGILTAIVAGVATARQPDLQPATARNIFLLPLVIASAVASCTSTPGSLFLLLTIPVSATMSYYAAPWCLGPAVPRLHRPDAGRLLLRATLIPAAVVALVLIAATVVFAAAW